MKSIEGRLKKAEEKLIPSKRFIVFYVRHKNKEDDTQRQQEEYQRLWGSVGNEIFVILSDFTDECDYEEFIQKKRQSCNPENCFTTPWWCHGTKQEELVKA